MKNFIKIYYHKLHKHVKCKILQRYKKPDIRTAPWGMDISYKYIVYSPVEGVLPIFVETKSTRKRRMNWRKNKLNSSISKSL